VTKLALRPCASWLAKCSALKCVEVNWS
jgi:hypothetical protein